MVRLNIQKVEDGVYDYDGGPDYERESHPVPGKSPRTGIEFTETERRRSRQRDKQRKQKRERLTGDSEE